MKSVKTVMDSESNPTTLLVIGNSRKNAQESINVGVIEVYNKKTNEWDFYHDIGNEIKDFTTILYKENLLILGGYNSFNHVKDVKLFDLKTFQISSLPSMNHEREYFSATVIDDNVYVCGGWGDELYSTVNTVEVWNPLLSKWLDLPPMIERRNGHAAVNYKGKLYIFGGFNPNSNGMDSVEYYDPSKYAWFKAAPMKDKIKDLSATVVGDKIYVIGGVGHDPNSIKMINVYQPESDTWLESLEMITTVNKFAAAMHDHKIIISGGRREENGNGTKDVFQFDPVTTKMVPHSLHLHNRCWHSLVVVPENLINSKK